MISIEPAKPGDADAVWGLLQRFAKSYVPSRHSFDSDYPRLIDDAASSLLVARIGGHPVGYLLAHKTLTLFAGGPILEILELYVEEALRGKGIGKALVHSAVEGAWSDGCLEAVVPTRRAAGFYETLGFEQSASYLKLRSVDLNTSS